MSARVLVIVAAALLAIVAGPPSSALAVSYDRDAAVSWATRHVRDTPAADSACTWFVSQALWAGKLAKTRTWTSAGHHGGRRRRGTQTAWFAPSLVRYIRATYTRSTYTQLDFRANAVPTAQPGDVILYSWNGGATTSNANGIDHAAFVLDIVSGSYPQVSEWSISDLEPFGRPSSYVKRGWTWSQKSYAWLQSKHPKVQAFLLHLVVGA